MGYDHVNRTGSGPLNGHSLIHSTFGDHIFFIKKIGGHVGFI